VRPAFRQASGSAYAQLLEQGVNDSLRGVQPGQLLPDLQLALRSASRKENEIVFAFRQASGSAHAQLLEQGVNDSLRGVQPGQLLPDSSSLYAQLQGKRTRLFLRTS
jgi:hypothetical protein